MVELNFDHKEIASKSGGALPTTPANIIATLLFHDRMKSAADNVPTAIPVKVCEMMSILCSRLLGKLLQVPALKFYDNTLNIEVGSE